MKKLILCLFLLQSFITISQPINQFPYFEDFESSSSQWFGTGDWQRGNSSKLQGPFSGNAAWFTRLFGNYSNNNNNDFLYSPAFDIASLNAPYFSFRMNYNLETGYDYLNIEYTIDGSSYSPLNQGSYSTNYSSNYTSSSGSYIEVLTTLDQLPYNVFALRFSLVSDGSTTADGVVIDDFRMGNLSISDSTDLIINSLESNPCNDEFTIGVKNTGMGVSYGYLINYQIDNGPVTSIVPLQNSLLPGDSAFHTFNQFPPSGIAKVWVDYKKDPNHSNDTSSLSIQDLAADFNVVSLLSPLSDPACPTPSTGVRFTFNNNGSQNLNNVVVKYQLDDGPIVAETLPYTVQSRCNTSSTYNYAFSQLLTFPAAGAYSLKVWADAPSDSMPLNDTLRRIVNYRKDDIQIDNIISPMSDTNTCMSDEATISVTILNLSDTAITNVPVKYQVNNDPIVTEIINQTVFPFCQNGSSLQYTFTTPYKYTSDGAYAIKVWTDLPQDSIRNNDSAEVIINYTANKILPYSEGFETATASDSLNGVGSVLPQGWNKFHNLSAEDWTIRNGEAPRNSTGPSSGKHGKGNYLLGHIDFNSPSYIGVQSPCIDIPLSNKDIYMEFSYHLWKSNSSSIPVEILLSINSNSNGSQSIALDSVVTNRDSEYKNVKINLNRFKGGSINYAFIMNKFTQSASVDIAIDDIAIYENSDVNLAVNKITAPLNEDCGFDLFKRLSIEIENTSVLPVDSFAACYQINNETPQCFIVNSGSLLPGTKTPYTFPNTLDFSTPGNYTIKAYTSLSSDSVNFNDTATSVFTNVTAQLPYLNSFDSTDEQLSMQSKRSWTMNNSAGLEWKYNTGKTPSFNTGPLNDANNSATGYYYYSDATVMGNEGDSAILTSLECFDFNLADTRVLEYDYHMFGSTMGKLYLEAFYDTTFVVLDSIVGQQQLASSDPWITRKLSLDTLNNKSDVGFRFVAIRGNGEQSDISIDNFHLRDSSTSINEAELSNNLIRIFPNPAKTTIRVNFNTQSTSKFINYSIYSLSGTIVSEGNTISEEINISRFSEGIYMIKFTFDDKILTEKFIISR